MKKRSQAAESWFNLAFWLAGLFAFLLIIGDTVRLPYSRAAVFVFAAVISSMLFTALRLLPKKYQWIIAVLIPLLAAWAALRNHTLQNEFTALTNHLFGTYFIHEPIKNITAAVCFAAAVFAYLIFLLTGVLHVYWILYILTTALLIGICLAGIAPGFLTVLFMLIFQVAFWARESNRKKGSFSVMPVITAVGFCLVFALISWFFVGRYANTFYQAANKAEGWIVNTFRREDGRASDYDGIVNRGNIYPEHVPLYEVILRERPKETVYLRTFIGKDYQGGYWYTDDESGVLADFKAPQFTDQSTDQGEAQAEDETLVPDQLEQARNMLPVLWYDLNMMLTEEQQPAQMAIRILSSNVRDMWPDLAVGKMQPDMESAWNGRVKANDETRIYEWLKREELAFNEDTADAFMELMGEPDYSAAAEDPDLQREITMVQLYRYYMLAAPSRYLSVPEDQVPRLLSLCRQNPMEVGDAEETTAFIAYCLNHLAAYTTTPGLVPIGADPVEYALFESRRGYCQHFSSAATLMYRYYGIPSRYVSGYRAKPESFRRETDGFYHARLTEEDAHSWTEILTDSAGWAPVDLTPGRISTHDSVPGMNLSLVSGYLSEKEWNLEGYAADEAVREIQLQEIEIGETEQEEEEPVEPEVIPQWNVPLDIDMEIWEDEEPEEVIPIPIEILPREKSWFEKMMEVDWFRWLFWLAGIPLAAAALFFFVRLISILYYRLASVRKIFSWILEDLHYTGYLEGYDGTEGDIAQALARTLPTVSEEEARYYVRQAQTDAYSRKRIRRLRNKEMRRFHLKVTGDIFTMGNKNLRKDFYSFRCYMRAIS